MSESENESKSSMVNFSMDDIAMKFAEFLQNLQTSTPITQCQTTVNADNLGEVVVATKLSGDNYPLWANLMKRAIGRKGLTSHISKVSEPPAETDPNHETWQKLDHCVFGWIINNMEPELVNEVSQYPTAQELWEGLAVTYGSEEDSFQVYDLHRKASNMKQGELTLEQLWHRLQNIWMSIDRRKPNPMKYPEDITVYNRERQETRLFQFLMALNDNHEATRREILKMDPLPSVTNAYATVRREATNEGVLKSAETRGNPVDDSIGAG